MNRFGHGQAPRQYGKWVPYRSQSEYSRALLDRAIAILRTIESEDAKRVVGDYDYMKEVGK